MRAAVRRLLVYSGNRAFTWLWWSQSISLFGSQVTLVAIPLLAALSLRADAFQMGLLAAVETIPYLAFSIPAGVVADRIDRRGLLIVSNLGRAALLLAIPVSAALGALSLPLLFAIAFGVGTLSVFFDVAYQSYVPDLLEPQELLRGNQRIELSESAARTAGPGIGGALVGTVGGAMAIVVDAISYVVASIALLGAGRPKAEQRLGAEPSRSDIPAFDVEASPLEPAGRTKSLDTIWDYVAVLEARVADLERRLAASDGAKSARHSGAWAGIGIVFRDRVLRDMAASTATFNLASSAIIAVFVLFAARDLSMNAAAIGILIGAGNVGFVLGALAVGAVSARFGVGPTLVMSGVLGAVATVVLPFATGAAAVGLLFTGRFIGAFAIPFFNVNARALRQSRAPREAQGRVNAVFRLVDWGTLPIGALLGGWVGTTYGLRATLAVGGLLGIASAAWLIWSPLRNVQRLQEEPADASDAWRARPRRPMMASRVADAIGRWLVAIGRLPLRWPGLAISGVALQLALILPPVSTRLGSAAQIVYVASGLAVLTFVLRNVRIPGLAIVAIGAASNLVAIIANGGFMPISPEAARSAGHVPPSGYTNAIELSDAVLRPLTDILVVPPPFPFANVYSVGDLLIVTGLLVTIIWALRTPVALSGAQRATAVARTAN